MHRAPTWIAWLVAGLALGCGGGGATDDAGATLDASSGSDAGGTDAGGEDAGDDDAGPPAPPGPWTVYVSVGAESRLAVLSLDREGAVTERADDSLDLPGRPGPQAWDAARRRLYVGYAADPPGIATVALSASGEATLEGATPTEEDPVYLSLGGGGGRLVSAYFGRDELLVHDVSGAPTHPRLRTLATAEEPHAAALGPSGLVYVPHRDGLTTWWLRLRADGTLDRVGELAAEAGTGPRHIAFHPDGAHAYIVNEHTESVSTHTVGADGSLTRVETVSALAGGPSDGNTAADVHVTDDGRFLYSSNRGDDSIARFAIGDDGRLTFLGTTPTEARPREFELTEGGGYLLALGQDSGALRVYAIGDDGDLTETDRVELGDNLLWATAIAD